MCRVQAGFDGLILDSGLTRIMMDGRWMDHRRSLFHSTSFGFRPLGKLIEPRVLLFAGDILGFHKKRR